MKKHFTSPDEHVFIVQKNSDTNGYFFKVDEAHTIEFWYDTSVRVWFTYVCDAEDFQIAEPEDSYAKEDIIDIALRNADTVLRGEFERTY